MLRQILLSVFGPSSKFVEGDSVQPVAGERELMVVKRVILDRKSAEAYLLCRWTDSTTNKYREHLFAESEVEAFDWNRPMAPKSIASSDYGSGSVSQAGEWEALVGIDVAAGLASVNGNNQIYKKLLLKFLDSHRHFTEELAIRVGSGEWTEARRMTHTFKGLAGTLGMQRLEQVAQELEQWLTTQREDVSGQLEIVSNELAKILKSIRENVIVENEATSLPSRVSMVSSLKELEQSLLDHNPQAITQWGQIGNVKGHEQDGETLGRAIVTYEFEKALTLIRSIQNKVKNQGENGVEES